MNLTAYSIWIQDYGIKVEIDYFKIEVDNRTRGKEVRLRMVYIIKYQGMNMKMELSVMLYKQNDIGIAMGCMEGKGVRLCDSRNKISRNNRIGSRCKIRRNESFDFCTNYK